MTRSRSLVAVVLPALAWTLLALSPAGAQAPAGQMVLAQTVTIAEAAAGYLGRVGIRAPIRPLERAALFKEYQDKRLKHVFMAQSAALGNTATRLDAFVAAGGPFTYGSYPDIEGLIREQASELDRGKREATLHRIQQLMH